MDIDGIDPALLAELRKRMSNPKETEGVDPALVTEIRNRIGIYEQPANDEDAYSAQHPVIGGINAMAKAAEPITETFDKASSTVGKGFTELPLTKTALKIGQKVRDIGLTLEDRGDKELTSGNYGRLIPQLERFVGITLENSPLPASETEVGGMMLLEGANKTKAPLAARAESLVKKAPGVKAFMDNEKLPESIRKSNELFNSDRINAEQTVQSLQKTIENASVRNAPRYDSVKYGDAVKKLLDSKTKQAANPLRAASKAVQDITSKFGKDSIESLAPKVLDIKEDLLGVIKTSPDSPALNVINKYLGEEIKDSMGNKYTQYPEASVGDLLKDRGRLGKAFTKSLGEGNKLTPQSTALLKLQGIIDAEVDSRLTTAPELSKLVKITRNAWAQHYGIYWSDAALALRKVDSSGVIKEILKSPESISAAKQIIPEVLEEAVNTKKTGLIKQIGEETNPVKFLQNELSPGTSSKPAGYYDRLFSTQDITELKQTAAVQSMLPEAVSRMEKFAKDIEKENITNRRSGDRPTIKNRRKGELSLGLMETMRTLQSTRAAVPAEATALASMVYRFSPVAAKAIIGVGVAPAALAWAYYSVPKQIRTRIISAMKHVVEQGPKAPAADLQLLRRIDRGENLDKSGNPRPLGALQSLAKPQGDTLDGVIPRGRASPSLDGYTPVSNTANQPEGQSEPLTYEEAKARGLTN